MAFMRIGNEPREWQRENSYNCDSGRGRETRAELE